MRQPVPVLLHPYPYSLSYFMHVCFRYVNCIHVASGFLFTGSGDRTIRKYEMDLENPTSETNGVYIHVSTPYCRSPKKCTLCVVSAHVLSISGLSCVWAGCRQLLWFERYRRLSMPVRTLWLMLLLLLRAACPRTQLLSVCDSKPCTVSQGCLR